MSDSLRFARHGEGHGDGGGNTGQVMKLSDFRRLAASLTPLTLDDRKLIVRQAMLLLEQNYVHLPLKVAMHAINPLQRLRLIRRRLDQSAESMGDEWEFHADVSRVFMSLRDLHTNYLLPAPYAGQFASLPFMIEKAQDEGVDSYVVTRTEDGFSDPHFGVGVQVRHWNGTRIAAAVVESGERFAGSNKAANLARGLDSLTLRPLRLHLPPEEDWVEVTYVDTRGVERTRRFDWEVRAIEPAMTASDAVAPRAVKAVDLDSEEKYHAKKALYFPDVIRMERALHNNGPGEPVAARPGDEKTSMPGVFQARRVPTKYGTYGHLRIFTFNVDDPIEFRDEFIRLAGLLPQDGLIVDVRDNGGGHIYAAEFILQALTPRYIQPEPFQFINTPVNLDLCTRHQREDPDVDLEPWVNSLEQATEIGSVFSNASPITPEDGANEIGQTYHGPVVLITDARCYSATDIFAAGFADHKIGDILGVDDNTGAGGANVWTHRLLSELMERPHRNPASPYESLPRDTEMRVAIRRSLRVGDIAGTPVEDLGVKTPRLHRLTTMDLLKGNKDLLDEAGGLLKGRPVRRLDVADLSLVAGTLTVHLATAELDRVDVYVDERPQRSLAIAGATVTFTIDHASAGQRLRLAGFALVGDDLELVASRTVPIGDGSSAFPLTPPQRMRKLGPWTSLRKEESMARTEITQGDLDGLSAKLAALELNEAQRALLYVLLDLASKQLSGTGVHGSDVVVGSVVHEGPTNLATKLTDLTDLMDLMSTIPGAGGKRPKGWSIGGGP